MRLARRKPQRVQRWITAHSPSPFIQTPIGSMSPRQPARRSPGRFKRVGQPSRPARAAKLTRFDAGFVGTKAEWLARMTRILTLAAGLLKRRAYLLVFIGDMYADDRYHCLSAELGQALEAVPGLCWKANLVWYDVSKKLHLYGYQYAYIPSMVHQNILVFRKE